MSIYAILASKPHNPHYLNRYVSFIESCKQVNEGFEGYTEKHHICPKALFPEYKSFTKHPWNKVLLTARQHFIAHWILWKAYPDDNSMMFAFWNMSCTRKLKPSSRAYESLREEHNKNIRMKFENGTHHLIGLNEKRVQDVTHPFLGPENNRKRIENGTHNWLDIESKRKEQRRRVNNGTHHFLGGEIQIKRVKNGTHHFLGGEIQRNNNKKKVENGTHNFLGPNHNNNRVKNGTHPFLGGEVQRKRVENGTHNLLGNVSCYDKIGNYISVPKEVYHNQTGPMEDREYVHFNTREGKRRKSLLSS